MSLKEPILSPRAVELKAQANDLFKSGDFDKAFDVFTAAISEENQSPALYSNRSATAIKMKNFDQALRDAEKAVKLDADWDKAHGRVATAHECLDQYQAARASYLKAADISKDARQKGEFTGAARRMENKIQNAVNGRMDEAELLYEETMGARRLIALSAQGHSYPLDSAVQRHCYVSQCINNCWKKLQKLQSFPIQWPQPTQWSFGHNLLT